MQAETLIEPKNWTHQPQHDYIGCIVISSPQNVVKRNGIRETWGQLVKPLFIMGVRDAPTFLSVVREADIHDDIIVENIVDCYINLTIKVAYAFKKFSKYYNGSKYFLRTDDDIYLSVTNLKALLEKTPENKLIGKVAYNVKPFRDVSNPWYLPEFLYPNKTYPPYIYGYAFIVPGNWNSLCESWIELTIFLIQTGHLVQSMYDKAMEVPFHSIDDVYFGGDIPFNLNYELLTSDAFVPHPISTDDPCAFK